MNKEIIPQSRIVFLVSCGKNKKEYSCMAKDMYISERFLLSRELPDLLKFEWYIISAKHGLLNPSQIIDPYDVWLSNLCLQEQVEWYDKIERSLKLFPTNTIFVFLASGCYAKIICSILSNSKYSYICPFVRSTSEILLQYMRLIVKLSKVINLGINSINQHRIRFFSHQIWKYSYIKGVKKHKNTL